MDQVHIMEGFVMAIKIVHTHGICCPQFFCDWCGERIVDAGMALYKWEWDVDVEPRFFHKGHCDRADQLLHPETPWEELKRFPGYCWGNLEDAEMPPIKRYM
jgi:hypothetical protein